MRPLFLAFAAFLAFVLPAHAQLSGTYTINPGGSATSTNYLTISDAVSDLVFGFRNDGGTANGSGVSGPVIFNIANGSYNEKILIGAISGTSATNRVTFQSASGDSSQVVIHQASQITSTDNYCVRLDSADYITFKQVTIERTGNNYQVCVNLTRSTDHAWFIGCQFIGAATTVSSSLRTGILAISDNDSALVVRNCLFLNNSYGIFRTVFNHSPGLVIEDCVFENVYSHVIHLFTQKNVVIRRNLIKNSGYNGGFGISLNGLSGDLIVSDNRIVNHAGYGIFLSSYVPTGSSGKIFNNFIRNTAGTSIYLSHSGPLDVVHNTIRNTSVDSLLAGIVIHGNNPASTVSLYNNNIAVQGNTGALHITGPAASAGILANSNYNNLYTSGTMLVRRDGGGYYHGLSAWRSASSLDNNSIFADPQFVSAGSPMFKSAYLREAGADMGSLYATDLFGQPRGSMPDIGAVQFVSAMVDNAVVAIGQLGGCGDSATYIRVVAQNRGLLPDTLRIQVDDAVSGNSCVLRSQTQIAFMGTETLLLGPLNTYGGRVFELTAYSITPGDENAENDTFRAELTYTHFPESMFSLATSGCLGQPVAIANDAAQAGYSYQWTTSEGHSSTDEMPAFSFASTGDHIVALEVTSLSGCKTSIINSITIYNAPEAIVSSTATDTCAGSAVVLRDISNYNDGPARHNRWTYGTEVFEDQDTIVVFAPDSGSVTVTLEVWNQSEQWGGSVLRGCVDEAARTVVFHGAPPAAFSFETDNLTATFTADAVDGALYYIWDFGDESYDTGQVVEHTYAEKGTFQVQLAVATVYGCVSADSQDVTVDVVSVRQAPTASSMKVFPNPTTGALHADIELNEATQLTVFFTDVQGRRLGQPHQGSYPAGTLRLDLGQQVSGLSAGMYYLHITAPSMVVRPVQVAVVR